MGSLEKLKIVSTRRFSLNVSIKSNKKCSYNLVGEKVIIPFVKLKLPEEQTELIKKRSNDRTIKCVHLPARQIGHFDARHVKFFNSILILV